jgi:hypothetical protein
MDLIVKKFQGDEMAREDQKFNFGHKSMETLEKSAWQHYEQMNQLMAEWIACEPLSQRRVLAWEKYTKIRDVYEALRLELKMRKNTNMN